jgi:hypothetical protein
MKDAVKRKGEAAKGVEARGQASQAKQEDGMQASWNQEEL